MLCPIRRLQAGMLAMALCAPLCRPSVEVLAQDESPRETASVVFSQSATLHAIDSLPALLAFVPNDPSSIKQVRAFMQLDGKLFVIPMSYEEQSQAFRGYFPTPRNSLSYRFQIISQNGRAEMSEEFSGEASCGDKIFLPSLVSDESIKGALALQRKEQKLQFVVDALEKLSGK